MQAKKKGLIIQITSGISRSIILEDGSAANLIVNVITSFKPICPISATHHHYNTPPIQSHSLALTMDSWILAKSLAIFVIRFNKVGCHLPVQVCHPYHRGHRGPWKAHRLYQDSLLVSIHNASSSKQQAASSSWPS